MSYVPYIPASSSKPPSPRTRELAGLLTKVMEEYKKAHPETTSAEIRAAVRLTRLSSPSGSPGSPAILSLGLGLLVGALLLGIFFFRASDGAELEPNMRMIILAVVVFFGIVMALVKTLSR